MGRLLGLMEVLVCRLIDVRLGDGCGISSMKWFDEMAWDGSQNLEMG